MQGVRELCDEYDILMISDEVMTGFGRTGTWFAVDNWDVSPDIITMAKGLTSGYAPLGAVGMTDAISAHFKEHVFFGRIRIFPDLKHFSRCIRSTKSVNRMP